MLLFFKWKQGLSESETDIQASMNEMLTFLYNLQTKMVSEHGIYQSYCDVSKMTSTEQVETYEELILESQALIDSYEPLLESNEAELEAAEEEYASKEEEISEGQTTREEETLLNEQEIANIDEDLNSIEYLLTELDADTITLYQISSKVSGLHSQSSTTQNILKTVTSLLETGSISSETKTLLVEMMNQVSQELLSMKNLEIESEELAVARWEELQVTLEARLDQLSVTMSQLFFQVDMYRAIISDNEQQVDMYEMRKEMLEELIGLLDQGCTEEDTQHSIKLSEM